MKYLGYDPGGRGTHGVAAVEISEDGCIVSDPICAVVENADAAWKWLVEHEDATALGIDTLLAWSPFGRRTCDDWLRKRYRSNASTVIQQNSLYSSMTLNGALVAKRAAAAGLPLFESHPKLLTCVLPETNPANTALKQMYKQIKAASNSSTTAKKQADDKADAFVAAWCAAQGYNRNWHVDLFAAPDAQLELVVANAKYPWFEEL